MSDLQQDKKLGILGFPAFLSDCKAELGKITKPTKHEIRQASLGTLFIILMLSIILAFFDLFFNWLTGQFLA